MQFYLSLSFRKARSENYLFERNNLLKPIIVKFNDDIILSVCFWPLISPCFAFWLLHAALFFIFLPGFLEIEIPFLIPNLILCHLVVWRIAQILNKTVLSFWAGATKTDSALVASCLRKVFLCIANEKNWGAVHKLMVFILREQRQIEEKKSTF